jgi:carboxypeptidase-like protein
MNRYPFFISLRCLRYLYMKKLLLFLVFAFSLNFLWSQTNQRIKISGIILSENQEIESVTVFNTSSNKGTITNDKGEFVIKATINDRIEVSALQFKPTVVVVDEAVIKAKTIKIYLIEHVNQLDVVLLSIGLSGNLRSDIKNVKKPSRFVIDIGDVGALEQIDKYFDNAFVSNDLNTGANKYQLYNGLNVGEVFKLIFKSKKKSTKKNEIEQEKNSLELIHVYSPAMIKKMFNVPGEQVYNFIDFLESNKIDHELCKPENELKLMNYLLKQRKLFLKMNSLEADPSRYQKNHN